MALEYYTSIDRSNEGTEAPLDASEALDRMLALVSFSSGHIPPLFEPGIYRYRSLEEAREAREIATVKRMRALRSG